MEREDSQLIEIILSSLQFQKHPGWATILSYLYMEDMERFARSHAKFRKIVNSYLEQGGKLVIGRRSWTEHFISSVVWSQYKKTTAVEVVGELIYGQLVLFPRLNDLTLRDFSGMDYADNYVPESLKRLTIINEKKLKDCELRELLLQSKHSLEHLYLGSETFYFTQLEFNFSRLKSLILVNHAIETVVDPLSPVLEKLHLEVLYNPFNLYINWTSWKGLPITSLTLGKWDEERSEMAKSCPNLKHLRILGQTFPEHKEVIESLNLESVDVCYLDIPETQDLMLNMTTTACWSSWST